jgi:hypothetical protein
MPHQVFKTKKDDVLEQFTEADEDLHANIRIFETPGGGKTKLGH